MSATYGMPGVGGSLGKCVLCGDTFLLEIILGTKMRIIEVDGIKGKLPIHEKCLAVLEQNGEDWTKLPDGPLKEACKAHDEQIQKVVSQ